MVGAVSWHHNVQDLLSWLHTMTGQSGTVSKWVMGIAGNCVQNMVTHWSGMIMQCCAPRLLTATED